MPCVPSTLQAGWAGTGRTGRSKHPLLIQRLGRARVICADPCGHREYWNTPKAGICSQCCWTGKSWGLLLVTLGSHKLLMGAGDAQIQFSVWVYQACRVVTFPVYLMSLLFPPVLCLALPFWLILASTNDLGSPGSFFPCKCGPALPRNGREILLLPLPSPSWTKGHLPLPCTPGNSAQTQKLSQTHPRG